MLACFFNLSTPRIARGIPPHSVLRFGMVFGAILVQCWCHVGAMFVNFASRLAHVSFSLLVFACLLAACLLRVRVAFTSAPLSASFGNMEHAASAAKRTESAVSASEAWSYTLICFKIQLQAFPEVASLLRCPFFLLYFPLSCFSFPFRC